MRSVIVRVSARDTSAIEHVPAATAAINESTKGVPEHTSVDPRSAAHAASPDVLLK